MRLTKSGLGIILSKLHNFENPRFSDEQYTTDSEIAATILWNAFLAGNIKDKIIADLGAGTGILGIGAGLLGAKEVFFVEKDEKTLKILRKNLAEFQKILKNCEISVVLSDVKNFSEPVDVVLQNPPFGIKKKHADRIFLEKAFEIAPIVYSFHKSESTSFLQKFARDHNFSIIWEQKFAFPLKQTMKFHKSCIKRIDVSCYFFKKT